MFIFQQGSLPWHLITAWGQTEATLSALLRGKWNRGGLQLRPSSFSECVALSSRCLVCSCAHVEGISAFNGLTGQWIWSYLIFLKSIYFLLTFQAFPFLFLFYTSCFWFHMCISVDVCTLDGLSVSVFIKTQKGKSWCVSSSKIFSCTLCLTDPLCPLSVTFLLSSHERKNIYTLHIIRILTEVQAASRELWIQNSCLIS